MILAEVCARAPSPSLLFPAHRDLTRARQIAALGLDIVAREDVRFDRALCEEFYEHVRDSAYWEGIVEFITSGPIIAMALRGDDAILRWREAMGPTW